MDDIVVRSRYTRYNMHNRKKKKSSKDASTLTELLARQVLISVLLLLAIGIVKNVNTPATNTVSDNLKSVLFYNIEPRSIYEGFDNILKKLMNSSVSPADNFSQADTETTSNGDGDISAAQDNSAVSAAASVSSGNESDVLTPEEDGAVTENAEEKVPEKSVDTQAAGTVKAAALVQSPSRGGDTVNNEASSITDDGTASNGASSGKDSGAASSAAEPSPLITPVGGFLGSPFGLRVSPIDKVEKLHKGIDIEANQGVSIKASMAGEVIESGAEPTYGNYIKIKHDKGFITVYAHCSKLISKKGQKVKQGDIIAKVGDTGASVGAHLHFEIWKDGEPVDPLLYIKVPAK